MTSTSVNLNSFKIDISETVHRVQQYELVFVLYKSFKPGFTATPSRTRVPLGFKYKYNLDTFQNGDHWVGGYDIAYGPQNPVKIRMRKEMLFHFFEFFKQQFSHTLAIGDVVPMMIFDCDRTIYSNQQLKVGRGFSHTWSYIEHLPEKVQDHIDILCGNVSDFCGLSVFLNRVGEVDMTDLGSEKNPNKGVIQFLETLLWQPLYTQFTDHVIYGKTFFDLAEKNRISVMQDGLFLATGYDISVDLIPDYEKDMSKLMPVVRFTPGSSVFYQNYSRMDALLMSLSGTNGRDTLYQLEYDCKHPSIVEKLSQTVRGATVQFIYDSDQIFEVDHLDPRTPHQITFLLQGRRRISVTDYFMAKYNIQITSELPCVARKTRYGMSFYPVEVLRVAPNTKAIHKYLPADVKDMIEKGTILLPSAVQQRIKEAIGEMKLYSAGIRKHDMARINPFLFVFGIALVDKDRPVRIAAHVSESPLIEYCYRRGATSTLMKTEQNHPGVWNKSMKFLPPFLKPADLGKPVKIRFVNTFVEEVHLINRFMDKTIHKLRLKGIDVMKERTISGSERFGKIRDARDIFGRNKDYRTMLKAAEDILTSSGADLFYIIGSTDPMNPTRDIFKLAEITKPSDKRIVTQHIGCKTLCTTHRDEDEHEARRNELYPEGEGQKLRLSVRLLIIAFDKVNPQHTDEKGEKLYHPKACAMTYMIPHTTGLITRGTYWFQTSNETNLTMMISAFEEALKFYHKDSRGYDPEKVVVYWDVSHGEKEVTQEMDAMMAIVAEQRGESVRGPFLTFITVDQNHNTLLLPTEANVRDRLSLQNVTAGTWIQESTIGESFTMVSYESDDKMTRAVKYDVKVAETHMHSIQDLTHKLTYLQNSGWRSVSVPAPLKGATKLAKRAMKSYDIMDQIRGRSGPIEKQLFEERVKEISDWIAVKHLTNYWA
ncbi:hypothetical protein L596_000758 [Steinernema carpocapsae]|uniref:Piwi domain-containing protein n=1 Tax=Steinernema carpocapsae TaxID=34508 RepID=A0A4V6YST0_STECR|nr:hypothetical protein L596_000758 [Steinernema carpocapsae]